MHPGLVGGVVGSVIGITGGAVGTYFSIKNTNGPHERAFMVRCSVIGWIALLTFLALLLLLPTPYNFLVWIPYGILLPWSIITLNRKQAAIREAEKLRRYPESS